MGFIVENNHSPSASGLFSMINPRLPCYNYYIYIHIYIHTYIHTYICIFINTYIHTWYILHTLSFSLAAAFCLASGFLTSLPPLLSFLPVMATEMQRTENTQLQYVKPLENGFYLVRRVRWMGLVLPLWLVWGLQACRPSEVAPWCDRGGRR